MDKAVRELIQCLESSIMYAGNEGTMYERLYNRPDLRRWKEVVYNARKILT